MKNHYSIIVCGLLFLFTACKTVELPGLTKVPTHEYRFDHVIWRDLITPDVEQSKTFYGDVFGWTFEDFTLQGKKYVMISHQGDYIGGMIEMPSSESSIWIASVSTEDVEKQSLNVTQNGGKVLLKTANIPGRGKQSILEGNQGEKFSFIHSLNGDPTSKTHFAEGDWLWMEFWADNPSDAYTFYNKAFRTNVEQIVSDNKPYWILQSNGKRVAGIIQNPLTNVDSQWVPYIQTQNPSATVKKVEENGGYVILAPQESIRKGSVGVVQDPNGAILCLQSWNL